jgi:hypothetical protein
MPLLPHRNLTNQQSSPGTASGNPKGSPLAMTMMVDSMVHMVQSARNQPNKGFDEGT